LYINNRIIQLVYRIATAVVAVYGLVSLSRLFGVGLNPTMFIFYTNISNLLVAAYLIFSSIHTFLDIRKHGVRGISTVAPGVKRAFVMMISVTMVVYHFILLSAGFEMVAAAAIVHTVPDILVHYVTPSLFILDWLLFDEKNRVRWFDPLLWLALPFAYVVFIMFRAEIGGEIPYLYSRFPYPFLDIDNLGLSMVLIINSAMMIGFIVLGYVIFAIDKITSLFKKTV